MATVGGIALALAVLPTPLSATEGLAVCTTCAAIILASDRSMNLHGEFHR
jgi:hypothetical protein